MLNKIDFMISLLTDKDIDFVKSSFSYLGQSKTNISLDPQIDCVPLTTLFCKHTLESQVDFITIKCYLIQVEGGRDFLFTLSTLIYSKLNRTDQQFTELIRTV